MTTGFPSKRISPLSGLWMPATHLIRVDLPAPLSPTSAMTSPSRTSKSTSASACTDPNDFEMPRSWRIGVSLTGVGFPTTKSVGTPARAPPPVSPVWLLAELREFADADVALLDELVLEGPRVVRLVHRENVQETGGALLVHV